MEKEHCEKYLFEIKNRITAVKKHSIERLEKIKEISQKVKGGTDGQRQGGRERN